MATLLDFSKVDLNSLQDIDLSRLEDEPREQIGTTSSERNTLIRQQALQETKDTLMQQARESDFIPIKIGSVLAKKLLDVGGMAEEGFIKIGEGIQTLGQTKEAIQEKDLKKTIETGFKAGSQALRGAIDVQFSPVGLLPEKVKETLSPVLEAGASLAKGAYNFGADLLNISQEDPIRIENEKNVEYLGMVLAGKTVSSVAKLPRKTADIFEGKVNKWSQPLFSPTGKKGTVFLEKRPDYFTELADQGVFGKDLKQTKTNIENSQKKVGIKLVDLLTKEFADTVVNKKEIFSEVDKLAILTSELAKSDQMLAKQQAMNVKHSLATDLLKIETDKQGDVPLYKLQLIKEKWGKSYSVEPSPVSKKMINGIYEIMMKTIDEKTKGKSTVLNKVAQTLLVAKNSLTEKMSKELQNKNDMVFVTIGGLGSTITSFFQPVMIPVAAYFAFRFIMNTSPSFRMYMIDTANKTSNFLRKIENVTDYLDLYNIIYSMKKENPDVLSLVKGLHKGDKTIPDMIKGAENIKQNFSNETVFNKFRDNILKANTEERYSTDVISPSIQEQNITIPKQILKKKLIKRKKLIRRKNMEI